MDEIFEKKLIPTKEAAELSGYNSDYLARLARLGKISGKRVGHTWFIDTESLKRFIDQQGDRKIDHARALARAREAEYAAFNSSIRQVTSKLTKPFRVPKKLNTVANSLLSNALAFSLALAVVVSGALVANAAVIPFANQMAEISANVATGFVETFGNIPSRIAERIGKVGSDMRSVSPVRSANTITFENNFNFPSLRILTVAEDESPNLTFVSSRSVGFNVSPVSPVSFDGVKSATINVFEFLTSPSKISNAIVSAHLSVGTSFYNSIVSSFASYQSLIENSGIKSLALASSARDALASAPRLVSNINLAFGNAIISATHAVIRADTMVAYGLADAAPASARATVALIGSVGNTIAVATSRAPELAVNAYLRATEMPAVVAPAIASAVFNAEHVVSTRFVKDTLAVTDAYLVAINSIGDVGYQGFTVSHSLASNGLRGARIALDSIAHISSDLSINWRNTYLGALGKSSLALRSLSGEVGLAIESFVRVPNVAAVISAVSPALNIGEQTALTTYKTIRGLFDYANRTLAFLLGPPPTIVLPNVMPKTRIITVAPSSSTRSNSYTTVQGISQYSVDKSLASFRLDILNTVAGMIQPIATQTALTLINHYSDRDNKFPDDISIDSVSATTGSFDSLTAGATALATTTITGSLAVSGDTTIGGTLTAGTLSVSGISSGGAISAPYFTATSTTSSTFPYASTTALTVSGTGYFGTASSTNLIVSALTSGRIPYISTDGLFIDSSNFVFNGTNLGIGTTSPFASLSVAGDGFFNGNITGSNLVATGTLSVTGLSTFTNGFLSLASSTITSGLFSMNGGASTTAFTNSGSTWLTGLSANSLIATDANKMLISTTTIGVSNLALAKGNFLVGNDAGVAQATSTIFVSSTGSLGIGSTTPSALLSVHGNQYTSGTAFFGGAITATSSITANSLSLTNALTVANGGTGQTIFTSGNLLYGAGSGAIQNVATSSIAVGTGISVTSGTLGSQVGGTNVTLGIANNALTLTQLPQIAAGFVLGNNTGATGNVTSFATSTLFGTGTGGQVLAWNNGVPQFVATTTFSSGLTYANGNVTNTGVLSLGPTGSALTGSLIIATSSTAFNGLTASTTVTGSGATITFANTLAGLLGVGGGGTGLSSVSDGQLLFGSGGTTALTALATSTGGFLTNSYTTGRPVWTATSSLNVALSNTTGTLPVNRGGTNLTSFGGTNTLLYTTTADNLSSIANTTDGYVLALSGGVPTWTATSSIQNGVSSIAQTYGTAQTGALTFATSSQTTNGQTVGLNITNTAGAFTFAPTISGTLAIGGGGTGQTSFASDQLHYGSFSTVATSSLALGTGLNTLSGSLGYQIGGSNVIIKLADTAVTLGSYGSSTAVPTFTVDQQGRLILAGTTALDTSILTTGVLGVPRGGTGWGAIAASAIPYGNGTSALSTTTAGTAGYVLAYLNGIPTWTATSSINNGVSSIAQTYGTAQTGAITLATTSSSFNGLTLNNLITNVAGAFNIQPTMSGTLAIGGGGTGQTSFGQGWLHSDGTTITSSTSPTVNYITATSTTATSTFAGGFALQTDKFIVQQSSGRIGIGTLNPSTAFDIAATTNISGDLTISGGSALTISATGPINQTGTGQVTFAGNVDATNGLDVTNANFTVGGNKFIVAQSTGNTTIAGTLGLTGALSASSTLQVTGATRMYSTLQTDSLLTAAGAGTGLSVTNNASIGGTLSLTGAGTFLSSLAVTGALSAGATTLSGNLAMGGNYITGLPTLPIADQDAASKFYVDSVAQGLNLKDSVRAGTTANITISGEQTIDGVALSVGDRVLVKDQSDQTKNGIYVVASGAWARSTDADTDAEVTSGLFTFVSEGTINASSGWVLTTGNPITLGVTLLTFTQFSGAGQLIAGTGISKSGNTLNVGGTADRITANTDTIDIASTYVGQSSLTTVGALTSGSIGPGFGAINIGSSALTAGVGTFSSIVGSAITGSGNLTINGTGNFTGAVSITGTLSSATTTLSGDLIMGGKKITGLSDPTSAQEAATKAYVDAIAQGLSVKASVRVATTSDITLSGTQTIDGIAVVAGDRVLVMGQSAGSANGIYSAAAGAWLRSTDADENSEVVSGMYTFVTAGTSLANTGWSLITPNTITLGTTVLTFTQFSGSAETTAGDGLTKTGNTINAVGTTDRITISADAIDIASTYVGQSSLTTVGALTAGSIGSGFGAINIGSSALTAGTSIFSTATSYGTLSVGGTATTTIVGNNATSTFSGGITLAGGNFNLATGGAYLINNALALNATTLGSGVLGSSLTSVGVLDSGSITTGFGAINIGADTLDAGATTLASLALTTALPVTSGGTGWANIQTGAIPYGQGTGALATTTQGTSGQVLAWLNGVPTWTATSSINNGVSSIAQTYGTAQTGALTFATSSQTTNGQTVGLNITNTAGAFTFAPTISGTLAIGGGGTGQTSFTADQLHYGSFSTVATTSLAFSGPFSGASSLGALVGGSNSTINWTGLSTTTDITAGNLLYSSGGAGVTSVATTTPTFNLGLTSGGTWSVLGSAPTLSIATSSLYSGLTGGLPYFSGTNTLSSVAAGTGGYVLAMSGGIPTWVATSSINNGVSSIAQTYGTAQTGALTFATSSQTTNGQTVGLNITNTAGAFTFAPTISGTLAIGGGGTGQTSFTADQLHYGSFATVATTSLAFSGPFSGASSLGALVGGSNSTINWTGLATTSQPSSSNILVSNGAAGVYGVATSSATLSLGLTGSLTTLGSSQSLSIATSSLYSGLTGGLPYFSGTNTLSSVAAGTAGYVLAMSGGIPTWVATSSINNGVSSIAQTYGTAQTGALTFATSSQTTNGQTVGLNITNTAGAFTFAPTISGTLTVAGGGTGAATLTGLLQGNGTGAITGITNSSTAGQVLRVTGASSYAWGALDLADTDAITGDLPFSNLAQVSANSILGNITGSTADATSIATSSLFTWTGTGDVVRSTSPTLITPALGTPSALVLTNATGLPVAGGGTGAATLTGLLQGNGTGAITGITGTAGQFPYYNGTNTLLATSTLFLATSGNVGIGTTTPSSLLHIYSLTQSQPLLVTTAVGSSTLGTSITNEVNDDTLSPILEQYRSRGTPSAKTTTVTGDVLGAWTTYAYTGTIWKSNPVISSEAESMAGQNGVMTRIVFSTDSGGLSSEKMRIDSVGNIGIGTTTPGTLLSLGNTGANTINISATATSTFGSGINIRTGCFAVNGVCVGGGGGSGTVTSVDMSVPTGLTISGNPVTTSGTLALSLTAGYNIPLTASTTNWNTFYDTPSNRITAGTNLSWAGNTLNATGGSTSAFEIATTSTIAVPQLAYFTQASGKTTLGGVATTSLTASGVLSLSQPISVIGASASALTLTGGTAGQILGWASGVPTWLATTTFSSGLTFLNGNVTADLGTAIDISSETNLSGDTEIVLTGDALSIAASIARDSELPAVVTAGDGLTRTADDIDCDIASGSIFGCLASADWSTFNNKQATISATYPVTLTGATLSLAFGTTTSNTWAGTQTFGAISNTGGYTQSGTSANTFTGTPTFSNATYSALFTGGNVGIGTTTPFANLSIHANNGNTNTMLFAIASSTATATTTLFSVDNTGLTTIGDSSGTGNASLLFGSDADAWNMGYNSTDKSFNIASSTGFSSNVAFTISKGATTNNVGIGTTSPYAKLSLVDTAASLHDVFAISSSTSGLIFKVDSYGSTYGDGAYTSPAADYAEYFYTNSTNLKSGETVCVDILENNAVKRCERGADNNVMGIVSTKPAVIGNYIKAAESDPSHYAVIGMLGQVDAFVSAENGPINVGDSLTSASSTPGYAMRANGGDSTVGIALEPLSDGTGKIKVLISRRNKSLAVEEVDSLVVERIAGMKIEDSVQLLIKQSVDNLNLDPKITKIAQDETEKLSALLTAGINDSTSAIAKLNEDFAGLSAGYSKITSAITIDDVGNLDIVGDVGANAFIVRVGSLTSTVSTSSSQVTLPSDVLTADGKGVDLYKLATYNLAGVAALAAKLDAQDLRLTALETRVDALESGAVSSASGTPSFSSSTLASALESLGVFISKGIAQFGTLVFDQFVAATNSAGTSSAGTVTILAGNTVAQVENAYVLPSSKIFVTFTASTTGSWYISDKQAGSFKLVLEKAQTTDASFDYFLVQTEGQMATSTPSNATDDSQQPTSNTNDTTPPVITLLGGNPARLSVGSTYVDAGVTAVDAVDGAVSVDTFVDGIEGSVDAIDTSSQATHIITYSANDKKGNNATATRAVIVGADSAETANNQQPTSETDAPTSDVVADSTTPVVSDVEPPVVTLLGDAAMQITVGDTFTDPGATASDDIDPSTELGAGGIDLTANIVVTGTVDTATAGLYTLTYAATDSAGNAGSVSRVVTVVNSEPPVVRAVELVEPVVPAPETSPADASTT